MKTPVAIAGAGPVGLALACALGHHGVGCVVLEEDEALSRHSKAPGVLPRTLEIFRAWGVLDRFLDTGTLLTRPGVWSPGAREPIVTIDVSQLDGMTAVDLLTRGFLLAPPLLRRGTLAAARLAISQPPLLRRLLRRRPRRMDGRAALRRGAERGRATGARAAVVPQR